MTGVTPSALQTAQQRVRRWGHVAALGIGSLVFLGSAAALTLTLIGNASLAEATGPSTSFTAAQTAAENSESELVSARAELMELVGVNAPRVEQDTATFTGVAQALATSATSTLPGAERDAVLAAKYPFLAGSSALGLPSDVDRYEVGELNVEVTAVSGLDYRYLVIVNLAPVDVTQTEEADGPAQEWLVFTATTNSNGEVTSFEAHRTSSSTADALNS